MATSFPSSKDNFTNPNPNDPLSNPSHSEQHQNVNDAIEAIQTKIGVDGSNDSNSIDYRLTQLEVESGSAIAETLGLDGNNNLVVTGIENPTVIDSFDSNVWTSAIYRLQISKNPHVYSSTISVVYADNQMNVSEYDIVYDEDITLSDFEFVKNGSIINLLVTPIQQPVEVRFYRTALKK